MRQATVRITDLNSRGEGVCRDGGRVLFVPGAVPGDEARVEYAEGRAGALPARLVSLLSPAAGRRRPVCRDQADCGGCPLMPLPEQEALGLKVRHLVQVLRRIGRLDAGAVRVIPSPDPLEYRSRLRFTVGSTDGRPGPGFRPAGGGERVVVVDRCHLAPPAATELARDLLDGLRAADARPPAGLEMRLSSVSGAWIAVCHSPEEPSAAAVGALRRWQAQEGRIAGVAWVSRRGSGGQTVRLLAGVEVLPERVGHFDVELRPTGFLQVNRSAAERLYAEARRLAEAAPCARRRLVDLYCGQGLLALNIAREGERVWAVDSSRASVVAARANARRAGRRGWRFEVGDALLRFERLLARGGGCELISANPPRKGAGPALARLAVAAGAGAVLLVSCHPAALARDLRRLVDAGYRLQAVSAVDMFPQTAHLEALALVTR